MINKKSKFRFIIPIFAFILLFAVFLIKNEFSKSEFVGYKTEFKSARLFDKSYSGAALQTNFGDIEIEFLDNAAPIAVKNFIKLAKSSFYDGTLFHRVTNDFIQGGDPFTKDDDTSAYGTGGPGYKFDDEVSPEDKMIRGSVAMANAGPNTNGSQFFIVTIKEASWLEGKHTIFAKVIRGMDVVDKISRVQTVRNNLPMNKVALKKIILKNNP